MFRVRGREIYMHVGDYGIPLPFRARECCAACEEDLIETDVLRLTISRAGAERLRRDWKWGEVTAMGGEFALILTEEKSQALPVGLYAWRLDLIRDGVLRNALTGGTFQVGVSA